MCPDSRSSAAGIRRAADIRSAAGKRSAADIRPAVRIRLPVPDNSDLHSPDCTGAGEYSFRFRPAADMLRILSAEPER